MEPSRTKLLCKLSSVMLHGITRSTKPPPPTYIRLCRPPQIISRLYPPNMNILKCCLALSVCAIAKAGIRRDLGFAGVGSFHGFPASNRFIGRFTNQGNRFFDGGAQPGVFHVGAPGYSKGGVGNGYQEQGFGNHQDIGAFNEGFQNAILTPLLVQPVKDVTFDNGWKGIETEHGSIGEGHALANSAFGGGPQRAVIPVHENTNDVLPDTPNPIKINPGFVGFQAPDVGHFGQGAFRGGHKGIAVPIFENNFRQTHSRPAAPLFTPTFNKEPIFFNVRPHRYQYRFPNNAHSGHNDFSQNWQLDNNGHGHASQNSVQYGSFGNHASSVSNHNGHTSATGRDHDAIDHSENFGSSHSQGISTPDVHLQSSHGHEAHSTGNSIADGHGTNGHGAGHAQEKATSYQSFVIHSYKPVPVYAKAEEYKHEDFSGHEGSRQGNKNQDDH
ncbi:uncharacterized protein LOC106671078 [Cimex lectularius]|uniref:Uncharacterized protein n=1 Tax=Cimex lectularius TaxID=79782 RepID=A0A8I6S727_CIMLE|nr:uncharacterized protein LOC106671078 [Cimex lectularius]